MTDHCPFCGSDMELTNIGWECPLCEWVRFSGGVLDELDALHAMTDHDFRTKDGER